MPQSIRVFCVTLLCWFFVSFPAWAAEEGQGKEINTGQDFTKPLTRFDIRQKYQWLANHKYAEYATFRTDKPIVLKNRWLLSTRADLPLISTDVASHDNPNGDDEFGASDFLGQLIMVAPQGQKSWAWAYGAQVIFPMASHDEMGTGRYQIAPLVGAKVDLNSISRGSFAALLLRDHIDAGGSGSRVKQNYLVIQPILNINLPKYFFLTLAPEMRVNWENENRWFIPLDIMLGKMLNRTTVISLEYKMPVKDDKYPIYDKELEARVGFFF